jgi:hypothetical protein
MVTNSFGKRNFVQPMGRLSMHWKCLDFVFLKFCVGGCCFHYSFVVGGGKGKKYCPTYKVIVHCSHGEWWKGLQVGVATLFWVVCFIEDGTFKRCCKRSKGFWLKDLKNLLEASITIIVGGFNVVLIYCLRYKCS